MLKYKFTNQDCDATKRSTLSTGTLEVDVNCAVPANSCILEPIRVVTVLSQTSITKLGRRW